MFTTDELATIPLFSELEEKALEYLAGEVEDIHLTPGEYVAHEGEPRALAIVVEGKTELTKLVNGVEQVIGVRLPGELGGEVPMTLGTPFSRATERCSAVPSSARPTSRTRMGAPLTVAMTARNAANSHSPIRRTEAREISSRIW